jgi:hypothetical protein
MITRTRYNITLSRHHLYCYELYMVMEALSICIVQPDVESSTRYVKVLVNSEQRGTYWKVHGVV